MRKGTVICGHPDVKHHAHGLCENCYAKEKRKPFLKGTPACVPVERRLMGKFLVGDGCWPWTAAIGPDGRGFIGSGGHRGRPLPAYRVMYEWLIAPIPQGMHLDHLCQNPNCVRPDHLEPVTNSEHQRRHWARKKETVNG